MRTVSTTGITSKFMISSLEIPNVKQMAIVQEVASSTCGQSLSFTSWAFLHT